MVTEAQVSRLMKLMQKEDTLALAAGRGGFGSWHSIPAWRPKLFYSRRSDGSESQRA